MQVTLTTGNLIVGASRWSNTLNYELNINSVIIELNVLAGQESLQYRWNRHGNPGESIFLQTSTRKRLLLKLINIIRRLVRAAFFFQCKYSQTVFFLTLAGQIILCMDRYLFTATFRADGSSKFAPSHRWGYFPAGAIAWKVSEEPLYEKT